MSSSGLVRPFDSFARAAHVTSWVPSSDDSKVTLPGALDEGALPVGRGVADGCHVLILQ